MAEQLRGNVHLDISIKELIEWLRERELGEEYLEIVKGQWIIIRDLIKVITTCCDLCFPH